MIKSIQIATIRYNRRHAAAISNTSSSFSSTTTTTSRFSYIDASDEGPLPDPERHDPQNDDNSSTTADEHQPITRKLSQMSLNDHFESMKRVGRIYKYTWGFNGALKRGDLGGEEEEEEEEGTITTTETKKDSSSSESNKNNDILDFQKLEEGIDAVADNLERNVKGVREISRQLQEESTKEELTNWLEEQLTLATECLSEFMTGYRKARDDEIENVMTKYFEEEQEKENHTTTTTTTLKNAKL